MALLCVACRTENRDAAKFCKGCGGKLVSLPPRSAAEAEALDDAWGATVVASLDDGRAPPPRAGSQPAARASRPSALRSASAEPSSRPHLLDVAPRPRDRSVFWVLLAAAAIVVATGGLYVYRGLHRRPVPVVVQPQAQDPTAVPVSAPASAPEPVVLPVSAPVSPAEALPVEKTAAAAPAPMASSPAVAGPSAVPATRKPRKAASVSAPPAAAPPVAAAPAAAAPSTVPVDPPPPADPAQACAGRNFIATAQCLVVQCAKPEFSTHARCDAVRKQQRIDEEKRNPTNAA
ncbi:hypothetical protein [Variovorax arabinosiphilus]|uniref:hypothetical protein n=1 Tax=Variovorax arabinosiphilus TaxID=3053498 RepID=UPI0025784F30|nr:MULTISPECIES: hypothetical protein [unclassified Variovorax]MDM0121527.1 hypothetical protein [Variovorax sp. J2L1-78]MDM0130588.1 hypothetical protein [Variovorax sp. J2L1-63]MDM0234290.1 hypothetical protein [Variovorax sp. J2R1-6]